MARPRLTALALPDDLREICYYLLIIIVLGASANCIITAIHPAPASPPLITSLSSHITSHTTMFQRSLLRASRQVAARPAAFAPIRQQIARTRVAAPAIRWYSDAPAAKEGEAAEKKEDAPKDEAAQLKEQLEKKDKEIIDLKVRVTQLNCLQVLAQALTAMAGQVPPLRRRLPQPAGAHRARDQGRQGLCHPALRP